MSMPYSPPQRSLQFIAGSPLGYHHLNPRTLYEFLSFSLPSYNLSIMKLRIAYFLPAVTTILFSHTASGESLTSYELTAAMAEPVTRIACFKFRSTVSAEQKSDRTRAFLDLYAQHQDLILEMPKGGRPLDTPLNLTDVQREKVWDTGFVVKFNVSSAFVG
ncbi:unnamed protein product [Periconia digitata]|uniref:Uncharacterized protein n=1 Tax=Periconia digitata TaxID=1303443 RepID=A0A9W4XYS4_9PLEO|nr:unnamed protein product [Periconia digitata]